MPEDGRDNDTPILLEQSGKAQLKEATVRPTLEDRTRRKMADGTQGKSLFQVIFGKRYHNKVIFVLTVLGLMVMTNFAISAPSLLLYFYSIVTPILLLTRIIMYWKWNLQLFLCDVCYFMNIYYFVYLWFFPRVTSMFVVGFAAGFGPMIWAMIMFRNSMVFHNVEKIISVYIHLAPCLVAYSIRWRPEESSKYWHSQFPEFEKSFSVTWLIAVPFAILFVHQVVYYGVVEGCIQPSTTYLNSYRYFLSDEKSLAVRVCNKFGPRFRLLMYMSFWLLFSLLMLCLNMIWYNYFAANCAVLAIFLTLTVYNGATYYIDVFSLKEMNAANNSKGPASGTGDSKDEESHSEDVVKSVIIDCSEKSKPDDCENEHV